MAESRARSEDRQTRERVDARIALEGYLHGLQGMGGMGHGSHGSHGFSEQMSSEEKQSIFDALRDGRDWLDANPAADAEAIEMKQKEIEGLCAPIVSKYYGTSGSPGEEDEAQDEL